MWKQIKNEPKKIYTTIQFLACILFVVINSIEIFICPIIEYKLKCFQNIYINWPNWMSARAKWTTMQNEASRMVFIWANCGQIIIITDKCDNVWIFNRSFEFSCTEILGWPLKSRPSPLIKYLMQIYGGGETVDMPDEVRKWANWRINNFYDIENPLKVSPRQVHWFPSVKFKVKKKEQKKTQRNEKNTFCTCWKTCTKLSTRTRSKRNQVINCGNRAHVFVA